MNQKYTKNWYLMGKPCTIQLGQYISYGVTSNIALKWLENFYILRAGNFNRMVPVDGAHIEWMAHYTWVLIFYTHRYLFFCLLCSQIVPFKRVFPSNSTARCGQIRRNTVLVFTGCLFCSTLTIIVVASQTLITTGTSTLFMTTTVTTCILAGAKLVYIKV